MPMVFDLHCSTALFIKGLGFSVMESFCDKVRVRSAVGKGTTVTLVKLLRGREASLEP